MIIAPYLFAVSGPAPIAVYDDNWLNVKSLLHFQGADASTTFTDETGRTWTARGSTALSTAQAKFGTSSLFVGLHAVGNTGNAGITAANAEDFQLDNGDFTIEFQIYFLEFVTYQTAFSHGGTTGGGIAMQTGNGDGKFIVYSGTTPIMTESSAPTLNAWHQYKVKRSGDYIQIIRDGVVTAEYTGSSSVVFNNTDVWIWGAIISGSNAVYPIAGYMAECRVIKGVAREWATQTVPFPNATTTNVIAWNPKDIGTGLILTGLNRAIRSASNKAASYSSARANISRTTGKFYFETKKMSTGGSGFCLMGIGNATAPLTNYVGSDANGWGFYEDTGQKYHSGTPASMSSQWALNDVVGCAVDIDAGKVWWSKNGVWVGNPATGTGEAYSGLTGTLYPMISETNSNANKMQSAFMARDFAFAPPAGFAPWSNEKPHIYDLCELDDLASNYTALSETDATWTMNTGMIRANAGGLQSLRVRKNVVAADVRVTAQTYFSDDGGLVLRVKDVSNYYMLVICDSGNTGSPSVVRFFKKVSGTFTQLGSNVPISFNRYTYHDIAFEAIGNTLKAYVDGVLVGTQTDSTFTAAGLLGVRQNGTNFAVYNQLKWDVSNSVPAADPDIALVKSHLSFDDIGWTDAQGHSWTPGAAATINNALQKWGEGCLNLAGGPTSFLQSPSHADFVLGANTWTLSFWIRGTGTPAGPYIFDTVSGNATVLQFNPSGGHLAYYDPVLGTGSALYNSGPTNTAVFDGTWHHIEISKDASNVVRGFLDGVMWASGTSTHNNTDTSMFIGRYGASTGYELPCSIEEFHFVKKCLHTANFTPPTTPYSDV